MRTEARTSGRPRSRSTWVGTSVGGVKIIVPSLRRAWVSLSTPTPEQLEDRGDVTAASGHVLAQLTDVLSDLLHPVAVALLCRLDGVKHVADRTDVVVKLAHLADEISRREHAHGPECTASLAASCDATVPPSRPGGPRRSWPRPSFVIWATQTRPCRSLSILITFLLCPRKTSPVERRPDRPRSRAQAG